MAAPAGAMVRRYSLEDLWAIQCNTVDSTHAITEGWLIVLDLTPGNDNQCIVSATSAPTETQEFFLGLAKHAISAGATNKTLEIVMRGIFPGVAGGAIAAGDLLTSNGDGTLVKASPAAGVNVCIIGRATSQAATGGRVSVDINRFVMQGH